MRTIRSIRQGARATSKRTLPILVGPTTQPPSPKWKRYVGSAAMMLFPDAHLSTADDNLFQLLDIAPANASIGRSSPTLVRYQD